MPSGRSVFPPSRDTVCGHGPGSRARSQGWRAGTAPSGGSPARLSSSGRRTAPRSCDAFRPTSAEGPTSAPPGHRPPPPPSPACRPCTDAARNDWRSRGPCRDPMRTAPGRPTTPDRRTGPVSSAIRSSHRRRTDRAPGNTAGSGPGPCGTGNRRGPSRPASRAGR